MKNEPITVNDDVRIIIEDGNYCIQNRFVAKSSGVERWITASYFHNMEHLAMELLETLPTASNKLTGDLQELISAVNHAKKEVLAAIRKSI